MNASIAGSPLAPSMARPGAGAMPAGDDRRRRAHLDEPFRQLALCL